MIILNALSIAIAAFALYQVTELNKRVKALEARKPEPEKRVTATTPPKQIFEKPIVKNAKEVKPLEIGDGRMRFDADAQIAEWI